MGEDFLAFFYARRRSLQGTGHALRSLSLVRQDLSALFTSALANIREMELCTPQIIDLKE